MHIRSEGRAHSKTERMARELQARIRNGDRVIVWTPAGTIEAEQWLANRGYSSSEPGDDLPFPIERR